jgi:hypothetical protein
MVRLSPAEHATLLALCQAANVSLGGLMRVCAVRYASAAVRDVQDGSVRIRRRDVERPQGIPVEPRGSVSGVGVEPVLPVPRSKPKPRQAAKPIKGLRRASELVPGGTQADWDLARQAKLNEARVRPAAKKGKRGGL